MKKSKGAQRREDLQDEVQECGYCKESYLASVKNNRESHFTAYKNQGGLYYYYSYCKSCKSEYDKLKRRGINTEEVKEYLRQKKELLKANRRWSIYKITFDLTSIEDKLEKCFTRWHNHYQYVGLTKREPKNRWNEHLYNLRKNNHTNYAMQMMYKKVKKVYPNLSDEEYENILLNDIIKFEVITTLDKDMSFSEAKTWECFEIKRLEHEILQQIKNKQYDFKISNHELMHLKDDMIVNKEHCISTQRALNEHKKTTQSLVAESCF